MENARRLEGLRTFDRSSVSSLLIFDFVEECGKKRGKMMMEMVLLRHKVDKTVPKRSQRDDVLLKQH
jgi:nitrate reductase assembly molybdenum cofactor insertion protein NarJ